MKPSLLIVPALLVIVPLSIWHGAPKPADRKAEAVEACTKIWNDHHLAAQYAKPMCHCIYNKAEKRGQIKPFSPILKDDEDGMALLGECGREQGISWDGA